MDFFTSYFDFVRRLSCPWRANPANAGQIYGVLGDREGAEVILNKKSTLLKVDFLFKVFQARF